MFEKPNLPDGRIIACLQDAYGLQVVQLVFLPLGADPNTAVYRCLLYTSDAADERSSVDLGGRRIIKKKN